MDFNHADTCSQPKKVETTLIFISLAKQEVSVEKAWGSKPKCCAPKAKTK